MSFIDKYCAIFNNSVGQHSVNISRAEFANLLGVFSKQEQQLNQLKQILAKIKEICNNNDELQGDFNLVDCDKYKLGKHNLANKILQKTSECEVENAR